ncbi:2-hydroxychromene-2-carboxylate isomerase [Sneathiella chinensis]|uniref:2-hydroxychromene-2-carboxylate isomerase n=1 Tax=Sneathiella chinensis TaxID=349750 RepID=A0ABQ5U7L7_9PROT|nr:2-hydroxychromene-2-carboxylate isomerase [Sneathiella chinensis]GLQ07730.1 2-hydroxychromene-2-carboxylate isomerase [Sneathiella chinensis]
MSDPIEFFFEFVSPYAYVAAHQINAVGDKHGREVIWRPLSLGHVWKMIGATNVGPGGLQQKSKYIMMDSARSAKLTGLPMAKPAVFPVDAKLARLTYYRLAEKDPAVARKFALGVFDKFWAHSEEITDVAHLADLMKSLDVDPAELDAALGDDAAKAAMIASTQAAVDCGAFGMPWFRVGDQVFWGADRVAHIDQYLAQQG